MLVRLPEVEQAYVEHRRTYTGECVFCDAHDREPEHIIEETETAYVIRNAFPYHAWDNQIITDHLMVIPKRHVLTLSDFTEQENQEFLDILQRYESNHHSVYLRSQSNNTRTVGHLHTHLLKPVLQ